MRRILLLLSTIIVVAGGLFCCNADKSKRRLSFVPGFVVGQKFKDRQFTTENQNHNPRTVGYFRQQKAPKQSSSSSSLLQSTKGTAPTTSTSSTASSNKKIVWDSEDLDAFALKEGVELTKSTLGPGFRVVVRSSQNTSTILGYGEGFVRPAGNILHLDKMEVFQPIVQQVRKENPDFRNGGTTFGVGLIFGYECLLHGTSTWTFASSSGGLLFAQC